MIMSNVRKIAGGKTVSARFLNCARPRANDEITGVWMSSLVFSINVCLLAQELLELIGVANKFGHALDLFISRSRQIDLDNASHSPGPRGHHSDDIG
jgi:hypothetical protein